MIEESRVESAVDYLRSSCTDAAQARANHKYIEQYLKTKRALLMKDSNAKTASERESEALSHPDYIEVLEGYRAAVEQDEKFRNAREAAKTCIDAWQTQSANNRAIRI